jgi:flagellar basal body P-ring protein FlgI
LNDLSQIEFEESKGKVSSFIWVEYDQIDVKEEHSRAFVFAPGSTLRRIVNAINAVGAGSGELVAILEALKQVGALNASLIII